LTKRLAILAAAALFTFSASLDAHAARAVMPNACEREMTRAAKRYDIPLGVLYAVGLTETGKRGSLQPFAMNIEGRAHYSESVAKAVKDFEAARADGAVLIDIGCMQINQHYHGDAFASVEAMFDPRRNVDYAAAFLKQLKAREGTWTMAVARYHAGPNNNPAQKRYVCAVIANMVATGFGSWTKNARLFCG
jgi:soluble lytic murein transglycosylase-like protein